MGVYGSFLAISLIFSTFFQPFRPEVFTSTSQLSEHTKVEQSLDKALQNYIKKEKQRLKKLKTFLRLKKKQSQKRLLDLEDLSGLTISPVDAFTTLNRFGKDWEDVGKQLRQREHREDFLNVLSEQNESLNLFSQMDFDGAMNALLRLSKVYDISPQNLLQGKIDKRSVKTVCTKGLINNQSRQLRQSIDQRIQNETCLIPTSFPPVQIDTQSITTRLTTMDSFRLGRQAYVTGHRLLAKTWLEHTISMMGNTQYALRDMAESTNRSEVLNYLAFIEYLFANYKKSLSYYQEMSRYDPSDEVKENVKIMEGLVAKNKVGERLSDDDDDQDEFMIEYANHCRKADQTVPLPSNDPRLNCYYDNRHPGSYLRPSKVETLNLNPRIEIFRDVLSDNEVDEIISLARPKLLRAGVNNLETGITELADYRISKNAWLRDQDSELVQKIDQRIGVLTGLNMNTAEHLQVNNYGLGGQYEPHVDHALNMSISPIRELGWGNRIATLMFYLSDVQAGGATVFIKLNVHSRPSKGDALFWYNLKKSGEGDLDTLHAGCPVLLGDKWVANKWIHEYGNEFLRPCGLTEDE
ncbi:prolyl 4-hydroxylase subunit alpha-1-like [Actinia tenebrosa]|uniref:procollagen-proline 4-dioxygenase n=1 Tax=Actinia tenebrosa TaxID=6105 RepID=A0A6P8I7E3_ACTTE|nr:prolyl 4-hydroxylase subunit alpha-1-like [Actinia tenebrosa]